MDDFTLQFTFKRPSTRSGPTTCTTSPIVPQHLWESKTEEEVTSGANENPVGTGPYLFESYDQSQNGLGQERQLVGDQGA